MLFLADRWGVPIEDIERMPVSRFNEWLAYFNLIRKKPGAG